MQPPKPWTITTEPISYGQIYHYIEDVLNQCSTYINELENDYYQGTSTSLNIIPKVQSSKRSLAVNTLLSWSRPLNELRNARALHDIRNGKTIRDLLAEVKTGTLVGPVSDESCFLMQRILDKTSDQLYSKLPTLANKIADCMNLMEKYFLSFYQIENIQEIIQKKKKEKPPVSTLYDDTEFYLKFLFKLLKMKIL